MAERCLRLVEVVVLADETELEGIVGRTGDAVCQPMDHDGQCMTPWTLMSSRVDDHDEPRRSELKGLAAGD